MSISISFSLLFLLFMLMKKRATFFSSFLLHSQSPILLLTCSIAEQPFFYSLVRCTAYSLFGYFQTRILARNTVYMYVEQHQNCGSQCRSLIKQPFIHSVMEYRNTRSNISSFVHHIQFVNDGKWDEAWDIKNLMNSSEISAASVEIAVVPVLYICYSSQTLNKQNPTNFLPNVNSLQTFWQRFTNNVCFERSSIDLSPVKTRALVEDFVYKANRDWERRWVAH